MTRTYEMRRRAERQAETRQRIVEATVALHERTGVLGTTISDIAAAAGVERATVYRHFPDERSLYAACTGHYLDRHPLPDPEPWREVADPVERLRSGLTAVFAYHRRTEAMRARIGPELPYLPVLREVLAPRAAHWARVRDVLAAGWAGEGQAAVVAGAVGHAIAVPTWQSLVREQGFDESRAIEMMVTWVRCNAPIPIEAAVMDTDA